MKIDDVRKIGIVGAGQMGRGISQVLATAGWQILLVDVAEPPLREALKKIREGVNRAVEKGALRADQAGSVMASIHPMVELEGLSDAQLVIEAIPEDPTMKQELFSHLGRLCHRQTVLASNTTSLS